MPFHQQKSRPAPIARRRGQREGVRLIMLVLLALSLIFSPRAEASMPPGDLIEICGGENGSYFVRADDGTPVQQEDHDDGCTQLCCDCCLPGPGRLTAVPPPPPAFVPLPKEARFERFAILKAPVLFNAGQYRPAVRGPPSANESEHMLHMQGPAQCAQMPATAGRRSGQWI